MNDCEINIKAQVKPIKDILNKYNITSSISYGNYMAKVKCQNKTRGKLILVTSTNPTPYGEGKTTLSIGLCDAMNHYGYLTSLALREPSLGPVFGKKGGATGGGMCQLYPMDKINLHFTGDFHAITCANNLIAAVIDDHIYQGNNLDIKEIYFERCIDMNDRSLRNIMINNKEYHFNITAASEMMTVFCLAADFDDLKKRIDNMIVGRNSNGNIIYVKSLDCTNAVLALLKDAFNPNAVATLNSNLALVHGGPFANIAHGCNSVVATKTSLSIADYTITEAGFGSDCGALKFLDIKCRQHNIYPDLIIINSTVRSLKYHGNGILENGIYNLEYHINNMQKFHDNVLVVINKFASDTDYEIKYIKDFCASLNVDCVVSDMYLNGVNNSKEVVNKVVELSNKENKKRFDIYKKSDDIFTKIKKYCNLYNASEIIYSDEIKDKLLEINQEFKDYQICISKTPSSISDNKNILGNPKNYKMTITDVKINGGGKFITILMGNVITLPGLSKNANYHKIKVNEDYVKII